MATTPSTHRECTVLFADLVGSTQLYERVGDTSAFRLVDQSIQAMQTIINEKYGRVIKHTGDGLMAIFTVADNAAETAIGMHGMLRDLPHGSGQRLAVRVGFHFGPVIENNDDIFGETVNFASRLMELASPGRAITTAETVVRLTPDWRNMLHRLPPRVLRGASRPFDLFELKCESIGDVTVLQSSSYLPEERVELRLYLRDKTLVVDDELPLIRIGRDLASDLQVADSRASRRHAEVELRGDKFVLIDRSSNGTFVATEGEKEFVLSREEAVLRGKGQFALGSSCVANPFAISYVCV